LETIYLAGGCLWGVQEFLKTLNGVIKTEAGRANGTSKTLEGEYDGYAECVKTVFDPNIISVSQLISCLFEIIDPYSLNKQGADVGKNIVQVSTAKMHNICSRRKHIFKIAQIEKRLW
jgi:peptide-methionine (S)-S-oxide reductase